MGDFRESPAVPPYDPGGDVRLGYLIGGGLLIALGWGLGVALDLAFHLLAPAGGFRLFGVYFGRTLGDYAWATIGLGLFTGAMGVVLVGLGREAPKGRFVLPGYSA